MAVIDLRFPTLDTKSDWVEILTEISTITGLKHRITHKYATTMLAISSSD